MEFLELVKRRKSCRKYIDKPVPRESIERCLEAARLAPSACNCQPWRFIVVTDETLKNKLVEQAFSGMYSVFSFAKEAPVLVVVIREHASYASQLAGTLRGVQYSLVDIGIAGEHFILQATEEGLGTCWIGWFNEKGVKSALGIPKQKKVDTLIALGYPQDPEPKEKKRKSLSEMSKWH